MCGVSFHLLILKAAQMRTHTHTQTDRRAIAVSPGRRWRGGGRRGGDRPFAAPLNSRCSCRRFPGGLSSFLSRIAPVLIPGEITDGYAPCIQILPTHLLFSTHPQVSHTHTHTPQSNLYLLPFSYLWLSSSRSVQLNLRLNSPSRLPLRGEVPHLHHIAPSTLDAERQRWSLCTRIALNAKSRV